MNTELACLAASGVLCLALPLIYLPLYQKQVGTAGLSSNREGVADPTGAAGRGLRAHRNLIENLVPFAIAVLVAHVLGISNAMTAAGALVFLVARLVHAVSYLLGITGIRTLAYLAGLVGTALIFYQLV